MKQLLMSLVDVGARRTGLEHCRGVQLFRAISGWEERSENRLNRLLSCVGMSEILEWFLLFLATMASIHAEDRRLAKDGGEVRIQVLYALLRAMRGSSNMKLSAGVISGWGRSPSQRGPEAPERLPIRNLSLDAYPRGARRSKAAHSSNGQVAIHLPLRCAWRWIRVGTGDCHRPHDAASFCRLGLDGSDIRVLGGPAPGICCNRTQAASESAIFSRSLLKLSICSCRCFPLLPKKIQQAAHTSRQLLVGVLQNLRHLSAQAGRSFSKADSALQQESPNLIDDAGAA